MADVITQAPDATVTPQTPIAPKEKAAPVDLGAKPGVTSLKDALQELPGPARRQDRGSVRRRCSHAGRWGPNGRTGNPRKSRREAGRGRSSA